MRSFWTLFLAALSLFSHADSARAEDEWLPADKALFDELKVATQEEQSARERLKKSPPPKLPDGIPAAAERILRQLELHGASLDNITDEIIVRSRQSVSAQLIKLADTAVEPAKTQLIARAKAIEGQAPQVELPGAGAEDFVGEWIYEDSKIRESRWYRSDGTIDTPWSKGKWRWLNDSRRVVVAEYFAAGAVDLMVVITTAGKPPRVKSFNHEAQWELTRGAPEAGVMVLPAGATRIVDGARNQESKARTGTEKQKRANRQKVAAWLVEKAKTEKPAAAKLLLDRAGALNEAAATRSEKSGPGMDRFRGRIFVDDKKRPWEFLPNGSVRCKGLTWGGWEWAKAGDNSALVIYSGGPEKAENPALVRVSRSTPGLLRFAGLEEKFEARLKE